jgi:modulator of FtsH protease HflC
MNRLIALGVLLAAIVIGLASSAFTVHQTQQVLVTQFGEPVRVIREPGLHLKLPFIQTVLSFDRRLLDFDSASQEVVLGSQRRLVVDAFTRYRITDPLRFFQTVGATEAGIRSRLEPSVTSALRGALANETLPAVLSAERARIMGEIRQRVEADTQDLGIDVIDVRIRRADLPEQNTQPILQRMQSERERVGREVRARGAEQAQRIVASADRERTVLLAEAQAKANALRGEGEQAAITIFAEAFQRDPEFFQFYRTMQAWREAFSDGETRMLLSPDSEFFRYFRSIPMPGSAGGRSGGAAEGGAGGGASPPRSPSAQR